MSADVLPFIPPAARERIEDLLSELGKAQEALLKAHDAITDLQRKLQSEKIAKEFYQDLATRRLLQIIELEGNNNERSIRNQG